MPLPLCSLKPLQRQAIAAIALALITAADRWREASSQATEAATRAEQLRAMETAFRHQAAANQQVVQGLIGLLREGR